MKQEIYQSFFNFLISVRRIHMYSFYLFSSIQGLQTFVFEQDFKNKIYYGNRAVAEVFCFHFWYTNLNILHFLFPLISFKVSYINQLTYFKNFQTYGIMKKNKFPNDFLQFL